MFRTSAALAIATVIVFSPGGVSTAMADTWGCSYEKCLVVCNKAGGKYCSKYCTTQLQEKRLSKVCK